MITASSTSPSISPRNRSSAGLQYDKNGDAHYDTISAFIKSVRGSDPDAALYWLAKMVSAGEDPRFILRRLVVLAGEDIGLADPQGMVVATSAVTAFEFIGMPEGIYPIALATLYLATAPKSNSTGAYYKAAAEIQQHGTGPVPIHLMDSSRDAKGFGHGQGYLYPHSYPGHFIPQQYLPSNLLGTVFYEPSDQGYEARIGERMAQLRKLPEASRRSGSNAGKQQEKNDDRSTDPPRGK
jgi:putative ATPase